MERKKYSYKYVLTLDEDTHNTLLQIQSFYGLSLADTIRLCIKKVYCEDYYPNFNIKT